jgi:ATP synthase protein I
MGSAMADDQKGSLEDRLKRLDAELADKRKTDGAEEAAEARAAASRSGYAVAMKLSSEFVAAVIVGALLGYLLDHFAGTGPWGMIVLLLLGFSAGVLNVMRAAGMVASPHPVDRLAGRESGKAAGGRDATETKDGT